MRIINIDGDRIRESANGDYALMSLSEYDDLQFSIAELKRINRERSNAERGLTPKKERSGYLLLSYDSNFLKMEFDKETIGFEARRMLLESPYTIRLGYLEAQKNISEDLKSLCPELFRAAFIVKDAIPNTKAFKSLFSPESRRAFILSGIEAQRNGMWAARVYTNYSPEIPEDLINLNNK